MGKFAVLIVFDKFFSKSPKKIIKGQRSYVVTFASGFNIFPGGTP